MNNKISIIVPIYNVEKYLKASIISLMEQTYQNIEIILVDDGSTDQSGEICDYYSRQDRRIKVIHQNNKGLAAARNRGICAATGEYIGFVDPDDWIELTMYEELLKAMQKDDADISMCDYAYEYDGVSEHNVRKKPSLKPEIFTGKDAIKRLFLNNTFFYIIVWNKLYKRTLWDGIKFPNGYMHEDEAVIHRLFGNCNKIVTVPSELYHYRQVPTSITHTNQVQRNIDFCHALVDRIKYLDNKEYEVECRNMSNRVVYEVINNYYLPGVEKKYLKRAKRELISVMPVVLRNDQIKKKAKIGILIFVISPLLYKKLFL